MDPKMNTRGLTELSDLSDGMLLTLIAKKDEDYVIGTAAFETLYERYYRYLYYVSVKKLGLKQEADRCDLVQATFLRVYEKAETYQPYDDEDAKQAQIRFLGWLGTIARNILMDMHRKQKGILLLSFDEQETAREVHAKAVYNDKALGREQDDLQDDCSEEMKALQKALDNLPERERHIIRVTWHYHDYDKQQQRVPSEVITELARIYNVTPATLRKIRERAMLSIKMNEDVQTQLARIAKEKSNEQQN